MMINTAIAQPPQPIRACRIVLETINRLHKKGFERLRIQPAMSPSGAYWRVKIAPTEWFDPNNGILLKEVYRSKAVLYSSGMGTDYFQWTDCIAYDSDQLASKFQERYPKICTLATGEDPAYLNWYESMLKESSPDGLIYAFADYGFPQHHGGLNVLGKCDQLLIDYPPAPLFD